MLYGVVNPSGRLPYTIAKSVDDYPTQITLGGTFVGDILQIDYTEGSAVN